MNTSDAHTPLIRQAAAFLNEGDRPRAIAALKEALKANPKYFPGWINLSKLLYQEKQFTEAVAVVQGAEKFDPLIAEFQNIQQAMQAGDLKRAGEIADQMLAVEPGHPRAIFTKAHIARLSQQAEKCVSVLQEGLNHSPANPALRQMLIPALEDCGLYAQAITEAYHLSELIPSFEISWGLLSLLLRYGQNEEALRLCENLEKTKSITATQLSDIAAVKGQVLRILGKKDDAITSFRNALAHSPQNGIAWWGLADMKTYKFSPEEQEALEKHRNNPSVEKKHQCMMSFSLARFYEMKGDWDHAMNLYQQANNLYEGQKFDPKRFSLAAERLAKAFTPDTFATTAVAENLSGPTPIFIIGLPRSGSTLVEQILASHSQIEGTMELPVLPSIKQKVHAYCATEMREDYLTALPKLSADILTKFGQSYIEETALFRRESKPYFIDKLPNNFEHVGLIHKILPHAKIIDIRRNPLDCGLSIFKQFFSAGSAFSYNLEHIAAYYKGYLEIMNCWDDKIPGKVIHVQYEELVQDTEENVRELLRHIGVAFEDECLAFHRSNRAVRTASSEQVRKPVNTDGVGVWRQAEEHLQPLIKSLGPEILDQYSRYM